MNKISKAMKGRHYYNNGVINKFCYECPEGFKLGRIANTPKMIRSRLFKSSVNSYGEKLKIIKEYLIEIDDGKVYWSQDKFNEFFKSNSYNLHKYYKNALLYKNNKVYYNKHKLTNISLALEIRERDKLNTLCKKHNISTRNALRDGLKLLFKSWGLEEDYINFDLVKKED